MSLTAAGRIKKIPNLSNSCYAVFRRKQGNSALSSRVLCFLWQDVAIQKKVAWIATPCKKRRVRNDMTEAYHCIS